jgi:type II secretory pathway pseudopilin PulG
MKLKSRNSRYPVAPSALRSLAAFTMVEIALSLAVIGFALVAIIGVLPAGMSVQRDNREETLINFDAAFLIDSLRSGAQCTNGLGQNDLTNYVLSITNIYTPYNFNGNLAGPPITNWFTTSNYSTNGVVVTNINILTNGATIVGLLSIPKYITNNNGFFSNFVTADFRTISGAAVDQGASQASRDFAFSYRVTIEVIPSSSYPYSVQNVGVPNLKNWQNFASPGTDNQGNPYLISLSPLNFSAHSNDMLVAQNMQGNLNQIRLRFRWPVLPNGGLGGGRQVYRTMASGTNLVVTGPPALAGLTTYFLQPQAYQAAPLLPP